MIQRGNVNTPYDLSARVTNFQFRHCADINAKAQT